jgi:hypothetical protein
MGAFHTEVDALGSVRLIARLVSRQVTMRRMNEWLVSSHSWTPDLNCVISHTTCFPLVLSNVSRWKHCHFEMLEGLYSMMLLVVSSHFELLIMGGQKQKYS